MQLNSFDFTLLSVQFTRQDIFQGGQVILHDGVITDLNGQFGSGSFLIGNMRVHLG